MEPDRTPLDEVAFVIGDLHRRGFQASIPARDDDDDVRLSRAVAWAENRIKSLQEYAESLKERLAASEQCSDNAVDMATAFVDRWFGADNPDRKQRDADIGELARMFDAFFREGQRKQ